MTQYVILVLQRIGYLAASQCFHESTDVIMLTTNQIRKVSDFSRSSPLFIPLSFFSAFYGLFLFLLFACLGPQQSQPVWHRCCPYWPLLFRNPWSGSGLGQWHHDTGGPRRMSQSFTNKDFIPQIPAMYLFSPRLLQSSVSFLFRLCSLFFHHRRCPTPNLTSERRQYWSCTRYFWSTRSPSALLSPGSRRNWRTQTQVSAKMLPCRLSRHHLSPMNYSSATNMKLSLVYLWHSQASSGNAQQLAGFLLLRLKCLPWHVTRMWFHTYLLPCSPALLFVFSCASFSLTQRSLLS